MKNSIVDRKCAVKPADPGSTLDLARFLRNTGPSTSRMHRHVEEKKPVMKHLSIFKKRKQTASKM